MDFLNKAYGQVSELFASLTPAARLTTGLLVAVIAISLMFLFKQQTERADEYLFGARPLTNEELARMTGALSTAELNGWEVEGNRLRVPRGKRHTYIAALVENNALPQDSGSAWEKMFAEQSPFENRKMGEVRIRQALQHDLAFTIREFAGIESASVLIEEAMSDGFPPRPQRRAAVTVKAAGNQGLDANLVRMIRDVVAFGGGIDRSNVVIADNNGRQSYAGPPKDGALSAEQNVHADTQRRYEQEFTAKIVDRLSTYPDAKVTVYVALSQTLEDQTTQIKYDEKPTLLRGKNISKDSRMSSTTGGGRPGTEPNGVGNRSVAVSQSPETENTLTESIEEMENAAGITHNVLRKPGLVPDVVTASVGIPRSYFKRVWLEQNPTPVGEAPKEPTAADLQAIEVQVVTDIEAAVVPLIPKAPPGVDTFPRVTVIPYVDIPLPEPTPPGFTFIVWSWLSANWQTLAMLAVALLGMYFMRGMLQASQKSELPLGATDEQAVRRFAESAPREEEIGDEDLNTLSNSLRGRFQSSGRSLKDELTELVRDDPDAAASVLQNWISDAA